MKPKKKPDTAQRPAPRPDDPEQSKRFAETAHAVEADETGEAFRRALQKVVPPKPRSD